MPGEARGQRVPDDAPGGRALRVAVVGASVNRICGVRDHAASLAEAMEREGIAHSMHWLYREQSSLRGARAEFEGWAGELRAELRAETPDAIVFHYSVFTYSHRGLPIFVRAITSALRDTGVPVVGVLHEFAYAWRYGGWRGDVWALSQRAALIDVMRMLEGALVTTDQRAQWLSSRLWLPRRRVAFAPVFSNLPPPAGAPQPHSAGPRVGLFGYSYQGAEMDTVLGALALLAERGVEAELMLLGAGGAESSAGRAWLAGARSRGVERRLAFSGTLPAQELSDALADCTVLLSAFTPGPSSRKGTLAASLASGVAVLAIDGPRAWAELSRSRAIQVVAPTAPALADGLAELLGDSGRRLGLGARGRAFAESRMGVARTAEAVVGLLREGGIVAGDAPRRVA